MLNYSVDTGCSPRYYEKWPELWNSACISTTNYLRWYDTKSIWIYGFPVAYQSFRPFTPNFFRLLVLSVSLRQIWALKRSLWKETRADRAPITEKWDIVKSRIINEKCTYVVWELDRELFSWCLKPTSLCPKPPRQASNRVKKIFWKWSLDVG